MRNAGDPRLPTYAVDGFSLVMYTFMYMEAETRVAKYGGSLTVRVPVAIARELDLRDGDQVVMRTVESGIFIERPKRSRLEEMLATVRERESEVSTGHAVGREIFD